MTLRYEVAETAGCVSNSFGEEDVDRHVVVWKKVSLLFVFVRGGSKFESGN